PSARWSSNVTVALHFASLPLAEQAFSDSRPCTCTIPKVGQFSNIYEPFLHFWTPNAGVFSCCRCTFQKKM
ncbi:hypothetical protein PAXRUDRAFT_792480, partial [Paxillus rubicundulus Ve08.2h10]